MDFSKVNVTKSLLAHRKGKVRSAKRHNMEPYFEYLKPWEHHAGKRYRTFVKTSTCETDLMKSYPCFVIVSLRDHVGGI